MQLMQGFAQDLKPNSAPTEEQKANLVEKDESKFQDYEFSQAVKQAAKALLDEADSDNDGRLDEKDFLVFYPKQK